MLVVGVCCSLIGWTSLYGVLRALSGQQGAEWCCRLVTLLHGVIIVCVTAYVAFIDGPWPFTHPGTENTPLQNFALVLTLGYFLFDASWCVLHGSEGAVMLAHHAMSVLGIVTAMALGESAAETCAVIFGSEVTNPLLQARWFLRRAGRYDGPLGDAVDVAFVLLFAGVRVGVGTAMLYCELASPRPALVMKAGGVAMYALAWVFMADIARFARKKSRARFERWREEGGWSKGAESNGRREKTE